eukprot:TRINITY_DN3415_c0_g1_i7.p2 TRINITY_DN3415_c0_g1~~TRINITY_DN3415_c0_g1_i7.p2  ORF type:complete len:130 (-),score=27.04 TRINITY_DN3415_c0_g1_i7:94-483(-)
MSSLFVPDDEDLLVIKEERKQAGYPLFSTLLSVVVNYPHTNVIEERVLPVGTKTLVVGELTINTHGDLFISPASNFRLFPPPSLISTRPVEEKLIDLENKSESYTKRGRILVSTGIGFLLLSRFVQQKE